MTSGHRRGVGAVLPTRLMVLSVSLVALAGLIFVATQGSDAEQNRATTSITSRATEAPESSSSAPQATTSPKVSASPSVTPSPTPTKPTPPPIKRAEIRVVVFNNSNIQGLAGRTASRVTSVGWTVAGTDNWFGTVDTSTVYYPPALQRAARLLAKDLGISSVKPFVKPMRSDRLTVILTADYR